MPTLQQLLKARLTMVRQDLDAVFARLSDSDVPWSPREGMRTVGGQLYEIANKETEILAWLQTGAWPDPEHHAFDPTTSTIDQIRSSMDSIRTSTFSYIDSLTEKDLEELIPCPEGWWEAMRLTECPKHEILRNIAVHEWYHTGQLITYLWTRGDDPYDWQ